MRRWKRPSATTRRLLRFFHMACILFVRSSRTRIISLSKISLRKPFLREVCFEVRVQEGGPFASPGCDFIFLKSRRKCLHCFLCTRMPKKNNFIFFVGQGDHERRQTTYHINHVGLCLATFTSSYMIRARIQQQQQQYPFEAELSSHPNIAHQHVPPLRAWLFRAHASGATASGCRAGSASRDNRVGPTKHSSLTETNRSGISHTVLRLTPPASFKQIQDLDSDAINGKGDHSK